MSPSQNLWRAKYGAKYDIESKTKQARVAAARGRRDARQPIDGLRAIIWSAILPFNKDTVVTTKEPRPCFNKEFAIVNATLGSDG